ncbi:MAG: hypothetical protein IK127_09165 [Clostridia bacterium]|nr:hypothetical protein [Clostridia bacterium]
MKTDVIVVSSSGKQMSTALQEAEKVSAYKGLSPKDALHLRLLTEEMMGMMRSITGETAGEFWIEDKGDIYQLHLRVETRMNMTKRENLLAASTSGKNESAKGLMGRLRDFFDRGADDDFGPLMMAGMNDDPTTASMDWAWAMTRYEDAVSSAMERQDAAAIEAWDELEKSVVAQVADEVKVSIKGNVVEMTIFKKLS